MRVGELGLPTTETFDLEYRITSEWYPTEADYKYMQRVKALLRGEKMGLGFVKVLGKSIGKALLDVGITIGSVAALAGLTVAGNPETLAPIVAAVPGPVGMLVLLLVPIAVKAAKDAIKHRSEM